MATPGVFKSQVNTCPTVSISCYKTPSMFFLDNMMTVQEDIAKQAIKHVKTMNFYALRSNNWVVVYCLSSVCLSACKSVHEL